MWNTAAPPLNMSYFGPLCRHAFLQQQQNTSNDSNRRPPPPPTAAYMISIFVFSLVEAAPAGGVVVMAAVDADVDVGMCWNSCTRCRSGTAAAAATTIRSCCGCGCGIPSTTPLSSISNVYWYLHSAPLWHTRNRNPRCKLETHRAKWLAMAWKPGLSLA